jgi:hypothetical protein
MYIVQFRIIKLGYIINIKLINKNGKLQQSIEIESLKSEEKKCLTNSLERIVKYF